MKSNIQSVLSAVAITTALAACGDSKATVDAKVVIDSPKIDAPFVPPAPPALGAQVDRFGRPAVNTALNNTFNGNATAATAAKNAYNADKNSATWAATYKGEVAANLAILDSLDTNCGNQLLAAPGAVTATRYNGLATALADDRQWVNSAAAACTTYLAVEANATGVLQNADCGGRKLTYDVIDITYSVVAAGALAGVTDGIAAVAAKTNGTTFPYLAAPL
jgi:hypothetical protein